MTVEIENNGIGLSSIKDRNIKRLVTSEQENITRTKGRPFDYSYVVKDNYQNLDFGHKSTSDGKVVTGDYHVLLPDGRNQTVVYTADGYNGYQAQVAYHGEARYPETKPYAPAPSYGAPKPAYKGPAPVYGAPAPTYEEPTALYGAPEY
ncbi:cuticle protein 7-like [Macrobrachium nipponense]|uniref:cuticle protein 7-like n=1 Tax=Macrobrachium nipponense TaxID=159736 RepID=UPI0030C82123